MDNIGYSQCIMGRPSSPRCLAVMVYLFNECITAANVISVTRAHFSPYSMPGTFLADNGPLYISPELFNFAKTQGFNLITRSLNYAELSVKLKLTLRRPRERLKKIKQPPHCSLGPQRHSVIWYDLLRRTKVCRQTKSTLPIYES